jgi:F-type H+-transporting ATPase subunit b
MKRLLPFFLAAAITVCAPAVRAQQPGQPDAAERAAEPPSQGEHGTLELWKWANFILLAGALGYLIGKNAGPFFASRSRKIKQDIVDSEDARCEAEGKAAEVERRLASLETEIASLKSESQAEAEAEMRRNAQHTEAEIAKIQARAEQEIASAGKAARMGLKKYSAELAISLAEQKIRQRMNPEAQDALVRGFVRHLDEDARAQST